MVDLGGGEHAVSEGHLRRNVRRFRGLCARPGYTCPRPDCNQLGAQRFTAAWARGSDGWMGVEWPREMMAGWAKIAPDDYQVRRRDMRFQQRMIHVCLTLKSSTVE